MKHHRLLLSGLLAATLAWAGAAQANDNIYWSVGIAQPGISVGVSNAPPLMMYPAPVYVPSYRVVVPRPVYYAPPAPVYYGPPPGWGHGHGHYKHGHGWHGGRHGGHGRHD